MKNESRFTFLSKTSSQFPKAFLLFFLVGYVLGPIFSPFPAKGAPQDKERWNRNYQTQEYISGKEPVPFLKENVELLPKGTVLDLAMGEGRNGVYLATKGFEVTGIDISETGLRKAEALAAEHGVKISTKVADLEQYKLKANTYDVIICTYYLQRDLFPQIISALKPGGVAVVETFTLDHQKYQPGFRQEYLLKPNELLTLLKGLTVLRYQAVDTGNAAYASILARKPS